LFARGPGFARPKLVSLKIFQRSYSDFAGNRNEFFDFDKCVFSISTRGERPAIFRVAPACDAWSS
jgi:hypothetical protein